MGSRLRQEVLQGDPLGADEELPPHRECLGESRHAGKRRLPASALDLYSHDGPASRQNKVHLAVAVRPLAHLDRRTRGTVQQMRADSGLYEAPPVITTRLRTGKRVPRQGRHQAVIEHLQFRT